jgi:peptidoglycan/xylan/chitin deacetylase (PgdA/CDA1 family)
MKNNIFIIFYHKILPKWGFDVAYKTFDFEMKIIKKYFKTITLDDVYEYITTDKQPDKPSIVVSFDDGYADNFVYAYPILKKYGLKATIFPVSTRVNKEDKVRPNLEDYWNGNVSFDQLHKPKTMGQANYEFLKYGKSDDFLTVAELNKMKDVFDIQGHAAVHAKVFYEDKIKDIYDGKNGHWSNIYAYGESNDFSKLEDPQVGYPLFPDKNNLGVRRGFLRKEVKEYVKSIDKKFFSQEDWKEQLRKELENKFSSFLNFETDEEREKRTREELKTSKEDLESMIGQKIRHLSYPFGHYDDFLINITKDYFDSAYTVEKDIVRKGQDLYRIPRIAISKDFIGFISKIIKYSRID